MDNRSDARSSGRQSLELDAYVDTKPLLKTHLYDRRCFTKERCNLFYVILRFSTYSTSSRTSSLFYVILWILYILENVVIFGPELRYMDGSKGTLFFC